MLSRAMRDRLDSIGQRLDDGESIEDVLENPDADLDEDTEE